MCISEVMDGSLPCHLVAFGQFKKEKERDMQNQFQDSSQGGASEMFSGNQINKMYNQFCIFKFQYQNL